MRKYEFNRLIGNSMTIGLLQRALANKTLPQITIFSGVLGTGKSTCSGIAAMSLTCISPLENGQPCMKCLHCQANIKALESSAVSNWLKVINVGAMGNHKDVASLIEEVFNVQGNPSNQVFIFEECHRLKDIPGAQTALLAELDRMPINIYVIMCTTKLHDIDETIRSRALNFTFNRLTQSESKLLLKKELETRGFDSIPGKLEDMLLKASTGIPRNLIKYLDFVLDNEVTTQEFSEYVQDISTGSIINLLSSASAGFATYNEVLETLCSQRNHHTVISALKQFLVDLVALVEAGVNETFTTSEKKTLQETISADMLWKIIAVVEKLGYNTTEADFKLAMLKVYNVLKGTTLASSIANVKSVAAFNHIRAMNNQTELEAMEARDASLNLPKLELKNIIK